MSDLRTPWRVEEFVMDENTEYDLHDRAGYPVDLDEPDILEEIKNCVNACAGLNPEGIPGLVEAAKYLLEKTAVAFDAGQVKGIPPMIQLAIANLGAAHLAAVEEEGK